MNTKWTAMMWFGIAAISTACTEQPSSPDPVPAPPSYAPPSASRDDELWLVGRSSNLQVEWLTDEGSTAGCIIFGHCPEPIEFTVVSAECNHCDLTDPSPSATHDGDASFVVTPSAVGDLQVHIVVKSTQTQETRSVLFETTADAYRGLDVGCYVIAGASPQIAVPCGATRATDDQVVFEVDAALASGRAEYIGPADLARVTIAGSPAEVWSAPVLQVAHSDRQLAAVVRAGGPLPAASSVVVAWTPGFGEPLTATVVIPTIVQ